MMKNDLYRAAFVVLTKKHSIDSGFTFALQLAMILDSQLKFFV